MVQCFLVFGVSVEGMRAAQRRLSQSVGIASRMLPACGSLPCYRSLPPETSIGKAPTFSNKLRCGKIRVH